MRTNIKLQSGKRHGSVLVLATISIVVLIALGLAMLCIAYGVRLRAMRLKNEVVAMLAAEAGYEKAVFWMSQQLDMLSALQQNASGTSGTVVLPSGSCDYKIKLFTFIGSRPIYRVVSNGHCGIFDRTVDVHIVQAISGWDMGMCRVPYGSTGTYPVNFADGEIINMPMHINDLKDSPDERDMYIIGSPRFLQRVTMGESRYTDSDSDKYKYVMNLFEDGIYFDQPECRITDEATVQSKLNRFKNSTKAEYTFTPVLGTGITNPQAAVQLEFYVENNVGKVRITNNCTVRGYRRDAGKTWDFKIKPGSNGTKYETYYTYAYHVRPQTEPIIVKDLTDCYVTQSFGGVESKPGGQIFVEGNVVIGGHDAIHGGDQVVKGTVAVVATGNIWVADSIVVDGDHDANGIPSSDNPNAIGLIAQGVIKVIDPGMSQYPAGSPNYYPGPPTSLPAGYDYAPVAHPETYPGAATYDRYLSDPTIVEAAITIGGGGWGAENVRYSSNYGGRKEESSPQDDLYVRGAIVEAVRGVVGLVPSSYNPGDGYIKHYFLDERILEGILPGDIWLRGKYIPAPAGWHDYRL